MNGIQRHSLCEGSMKANTSFYPHYPQHSSNYPPCVSFPSESWEVTDLLTSGHLTPHFLVFCFKPVFATLTSPGAFRNTSLVEMGLISKLLSQNLHFNKILRPL